MYEVPLIADQAIVAGLHETREVQNSQKLDGECETFLRLWPAFAALVVKSCNACKYT